MADYSHSGIIMGDSMVNVLSKIGVPLMKDEFESSRRELWHYKGKAVLFEQGKVIKFGDSEDFIKRSKKVSVKAKTKVKVATIKASEEDNDVKDILSEVMKVGGASDVNDVAGIQPPSVPNLPPNFPSVIRDAGNASVSNPFDLLRKQMINNGAQ